MDDRVEAFAQALASTAIARDWTAVRGMLAPWLRSRLDVAAVQAFFEDDYKDILAEWKIEALHYPSVPYVSAGVVGLAFLREKPSYGPPRPIPDEVTDGNFRQWLTIQLQTSDEQLALGLPDYLTEIWAIVVEVDEGLRIGYWAHSGS